MGMEIYFDIFKVLLSLWPLGVMAVAITIFRYRIKPKAKGIIGEKLISLRLKNLDSSKYTVLDNVMIQTPQGTSQIDHIVVSNFGIFIIETKNYKGWITGSPFDDYWTQTIYKSKSRFRNPIRQNYGHEQALKGMIGTDDSLKYIPLVVFSNEATFQSNLGNSVVHASEVLEAIQSYQAEMISDKMKYQIIQRISNRNIVDTAARVEHVSEIKKKIKERPTLKDPHRCPKCGGELTQKSGKFGMFVGCSNYPGCKYTKK